MSIPPVKLPKDGYCRALVRVRDTYRRTGRTKSGFEMHYTERQCTRKEVRGHFNLCRQHYAIAVSRIDLRKR